MMRILSLVIILVTYFVTCPGSSEAKKYRCFNKDVVENAKHLLRTRPRWIQYEVEKPQILSPTERQADSSCSNSVLHSSVGNRSVSPWRFGINCDEGRYPVAISVAVCLHDGCVFNGIENKTYYSVPVMYIKNVLKKVECPNDKTMYTLKESTVLVPFACTCVRPRSSPNFS